VIIALNTGGRKGEGLQERGFHPRRGGKRERPQEGRKIQALFKELTREEGKKNSRGDFYNKNPPAPQTPHFCEQSQKEGVTDREEFLFKEKGPYLNSSSPLLIALRE